MGGSAKVHPFKTMVTIQIKKLSELAKTPTRGSDFAAGYDLYSTEDYNLKPAERKLFKTNIAIAIPTGLYGRVAPRSGLAFKDGLDVLAGVIDEDYRGDVGVILINLGDKVKEIKAGDKIAQIIFENYTTAEFQDAAELPLSVRATGGFGSTDKPSTTVEGTTKAFKTLIEQIPPPSVDKPPMKAESMIGKTLAELYEKTGGIPIKQRYSEEVKQREKAST